MSTTVQNASSDLPAAELSALQRKLAQVNAELSDPASVNDPGELIRAKAETEQRIAVAHARVAQAKTREYRARMALRRDAYLQELTPPLERVRELLPELRYRLAELVELEARIEESGEPGVPTVPWEVVTSGLRRGGADALLRAFAQAVEVGSPLSDPFIPSALRRMLADVVSDGERERVTTYITYRPPPTLREVERMLFGER